jgi:2-polyprenyl-6-methoxyphenol hydroxylase-like FAD-dependent oxidoreductase
MHPIAGQGWNLGVRDVKNITKVIFKANKLGLDLGTHTVCKQYNDLSYVDAYILFQVTDKLNSIFLSNNIISNNIRKFGFGLIDKNKNIKKLISNYAMGI